MNTDALQPLTGRVPADIIMSDPSGISDVSSIIAGPRGQSIYENRLQIDEADSGRIAAFARDNGWNYTPRTTYNQTQFGGDPPAWLGIQLKTTQPVFAHEVRGELAGFPFAMFIGYTTAAVQTTSRKNPEPIRLNQTAYITVTLPKKFPQMALDSTKNDKGIVSSLATSYKTNQLLQLEGNFAQYFDFFAPHGLQVNTLTVLAPNFMQTLIDSAHMFDVIFEGNQMTLVTREPLYTPEVMSAAVSALTEQLTYLQRLLPSWNYQPIHEPYDRLQKTTWQGIVINIGPIRLSPGQSLVVILLGFVLLSILILILKHYFPES